MVEYLYNLVTNSATGEKAYSKYPDLQQYRNTNMFNEIFSCYK